MAEVSHAQPTTTEDKAASISADIQRFADLGLLDTLLLDRSTGGNIIWACKSYEQLGAGYGEHDEIRAEAITGENIHVVRTRARKEQMERAALTKAHAEVFTPMWVCKKMIDHADEAWYAEIDDPENAWETYITSPRLEITCGEAPYLVNRYDAADGIEIPTQERIGILSRKLALAAEHAKEREAWVNLALAACKSVYGYEFQGNNLLIARINVLCTLEDFAQKAGFAPFTQDEYRQLAEIISWNLWQMDGITDCVPFGKPPVEQPGRLPGFDDLFAEEDEQIDKDNENGRDYARIYDWNNSAEVEFHSLKRKGSSMKFDYIIGNPPYQEESIGENASDTPIYHYFYNSAFELSDKVELISPARFLFNAGGTPKAWNEKMLQDGHLKVLMYEQQSSKVFKGTSISGGVAIIYRDAMREFGAIDVFTPYAKLNEIVRKVDALSHDDLSSLVSNRGQYRYSDLAYAEHPEEMKLTADRRVAPSAFERMPLLFTEDRPNDGHVYIRIFGNLQAKRVYRYFREDYLAPVEGLHKYKVFISKADGAAGQIGAPIPARISGKPTIEGPGVGSTETYISVGAVDTREEAEAIAKYIETRFARTMLGVLKVTQNYAKPTWRKIPLQDFTPASDIDWSQSVADIDRQLYAKYGLSQEEIDFIESHVQEMS